MLWGYGHYRCLILPVRDRFYTSESDVYRRQILTYKDGFSPESVEQISIKIGNHGNLRVYIDSNFNISVSEHNDFNWKYFNEKYKIIIPEVKMSASLQNRMRHRSKHI